MPTVQDTNYLKLTTTGVPAADSYTLTLKDNNGNVFPKTTIEINNTAGSSEINLPSIASLGAAAQNCEIVIVLDAAVNNNVINPALTDKIGGRAAGAPYTITGGGGSADGDSVILTPVDGTTWTALYTA